MIYFTDPRLYVKGICEAIATDKVTGDILFYSNKFQTGNVTTSLTTGEIRAGLGNPISAEIPSDSSLTVEFTAADLSLWAKSAQVGGTLSYGAPVMKCQTVEAISTTLTWDTTEGAPTAQLGMKDAYAYVQEVGTTGTLAMTGTAYGINSVSGDISDFVATPGTTYKIWAFVQQNNAQLATINSLFDPKVVHFTAQLAVYSNESGGGTDGTRVGWLYLVVPSLKLGGNAGLTGDQTTNDTTSLSGEAMVYDIATIGDNCDVCSGAGASALAYYLYVPDDTTENLIGLAIIGGAIEVVESTTAQVPVYLVAADGSLIKPGDYSTNFNYAFDTAPTGTTVADGIITAGSTTGDCELTVTYTDGGTTFTVVANVSVVSA